MEQMCKKDYDAEEGCQFGDLGTLATISAVTAAIKSVNEESESKDEDILLVGYNGLMMPVMEDIILAQRAQEGKFGIRDLLLFSTVCGVGIDTVVSKYPHVSLELL